MNNSARWCYGYNDSAALYRFPATLTNYTDAHQHTRAVSSHTHVD